MSDKKLYDTGEYDILINKEGKKELATTFGNFCPKCSAPSNHVMVYGQGLCICSDCDHVFSMDDRKKDLNKFWDNKK